MVIAAVTGYFIDLAFVFFIIFVHEMGHAVAASFFSWRIKRIVLLPFGGVAEMDEHGNRSLKEEVIVILAGPVQHLWMIAIAYLGSRFGVFPAEMATLFIQYNIMILLFNLFPVWPLDGGKIVFLLFSLKQSFSIAHQNTLIVSSIFLIIFFLISTIISPFNLNVWLVVGFLAFSIYMEWKQRRYVFMRFLLERYYGNRSDFQSLKPLVVQEKDLVIHVLEQFQRGYKHPIIFYTDDGEKNSLDENELLHAFFAEKLSTAKIGDLLYTY